MLKQAVDKGESKVKPSHATRQFLDAALAYYQLNDAGEVRRLEVTNGADRVLERLRPFHGLEEFSASFMGNDFSSAGMKVLAQARDLKKVDLSKCDPKLFPPEAFAYVASLPSLERLHTDYKGDMDAAMKKLAGAKQLRVLTIARATGLTDRGVQYVAQLQSLDEFQLLDVGTVTDAGMEYISQLKNLTDLSLEGVPISDDGLREIGRLRHLQRLSVSGPRITDKGIDFLRGLIDLRSLGLGDTRVSDKSMKWIGGLEGLQWLFLDGTQVTDAGVAYLKRKTHLRMIDLERTRVTGEGALKLKTSLPSKDPIVLHESIVPDD